MLIFIQLIKFNGNNVEKPESELVVFIGQVNFYITNSLFVTNPKNMYIVYVYSTLTDLQISFSIFAYLIF